MLKYSLLHLLTLLLLAGVAAAALTRASSTWECIVLTATLAALAASAVAALFRRPFAIGFAVFGWVYVLLLYAPWFSDLRPKLLTTWSVDWLCGKVQRQVAQPEASETMTQSALRALELAEYQNQLPPGSAGRFPAGQGPAGGAPIGAGQRPPGMPGYASAGGRAPVGVARAKPPAATEPPYATFSSIGQAIWLWLVAYLGGWCACVVHAISSRKGTAAIATSGEKGAAAVVSK